MELDRLDRQLIHALRIDPRASFTRLGAVLGASDQTVARRYRRLREAGIVRVLATPGEHAPGESWLLRITVKPGAAARVAAAIARGAEISWVSIAAGGSEVLCATRPTDPEQTEALLIERLPAATLVNQITAHAVLHTFDDQFEQGWSAFPDPLTADQTAALGPARDRSRTAGPVDPQPEDATLIALLNADGRAGVADLAAATGISLARVRRRVAALLTGGVLRIHVEISVGAVGTPTRAWIWMRVPPSELARTGEAIARLPETAYVATVTGAANLVAVVVARDLAALHRHITDGLAALTSIREIEVVPVLRQIKHERSIPHRGRLPRPGEPGGAIVPPTGDRDDGDGGGNG